MDFSLLADRRQQKSGMHGSGRPSTPAGEGLTNAQQTHRIPALNVARDGAIDLAAADSETEDACSGPSRTPIPGDRGQRSGGSRTAFRTIPDTIPDEAGQRSGDSGQIRD